MITFEAVFEIWVEEKIQYMYVPFEGGSLGLPKQHDMEDRKSMISKVSIPNGEVLDLVAILQNGETIWKD